MMQHSGRDGMPSNSAHQPYTTIFCGHFTQGMAICREKDTRNQTRGDCHLRQLTRPFLRHRQLVQAVSDRDETDFAAHPATPQSGTGTVVTRLGM